MIITKLKDFEEILSVLPKGAAYIVGCSECATLCHTGGEEEVKTMKQQLEDHHIMVTGWTILDPACHRNNDRRLLKPEKQAIDKAASIIVMACGNGVQTLAGLYPEKTIISATNTLFLGEIVRANQFDKRCQMCGECLLDVFDGICPVTRCPKSMLNGPCGGSINGKCEIDPDVECVWDIIYKRLKQKGKLDQLKEIQKAKDWSKQLQTQQKV